jgi:cytochrome c-type biogenesis protein
VLGREKLMNETLLTMGTAFWFGVLTSISPCPLSTNIAAVSYVARRVEKTGKVLISGLLYAAGRCVAYLAVAIIVTNGLTSIPGVSWFLQKYLNLFIGPVMLLVGVILLDLLKINLGGNGFVNNLQPKINKMGIWGAAVLGLIFALSFCPTSAGLFFGGLIPLALKQNSMIVLPVLYGIGTAFPVVGFSMLFAFGAKVVGTVFNKITIIEIWVRRITAVMMIIVGVMFILKHNMGVYFGV